MKSKLSKYVAVVCFIINLVPTVTNAITIKGKQPTGIDSATALAVVSTGETVASAIATSSTTNFELTVDGTDTRLYLIKDNNTLPVIGGILANNKVYTVAEAKSKNLCASGAGLVAFKKNISGGKSLRLKVAQIDDVDAYVSVKSIKGVKNIKKKIKGYLDKTITTSINSDCSPTGNAASLGLGSANNSSLFIQEEEDGDLDGDGLADEFDVDDDGDSVLDPYDSDSVPTENGFSIFTNLKVGIEKTINRNAVPSLTDDQINQIIANTQSMAIEVQTENSSGKTAELNCGSLTYCSTGGTGAPSSNPGQSFPEDFDTDADGFGTMTKGGTGDFQMITGATGDEIGSGDTLIQTITDDTTSEVEETYITSLAFAFTSTPAIQSMILNDGDASETTYTPSYPIPNGGTGTIQDPFLVQADIGGDVNLTITAYRPQRNGITGAGEAEIMEVGNSLIVIDIPNGPSSGGGATSGPGGCPITSYSETDTDLSISGDTFVDAQGDFDGATETDGDANKTVTFTVNITDCLAKNGSVDTLDSGEKLKIDLQFKNNSGDNAAQAFYIEMQ